MRLPERLAEQGYRYLRLAYQDNFIRGRKSQYVVASCLYIVCRMEQTWHMLIDFADILQINVFVLGATFKQLRQVLHAEKVPLIDPSIYIARFASMLDFGEDESKVASDATRLVARMKRDWIDTGRRPAGLCGACLLIAARMNNYRRSLAEIVHVVKVAGSTIQQRVTDFSHTDSANLTVEDFSKISLERTNDPPAFTKAKKVKKTAKAKDKGKASKKRRRTKDECSSTEDEGEDKEEEVLEDEEEAAVRALATMKDIGIEEPGFKRPYSIIQPYDPSLTSIDTTNQFFLPSLPAESESFHAMGSETDKPDSTSLEKLIEDEVAGALNSADLQSLEQEEIERRAAAERLNPQTVDESLADVDDDEINSVLLDEDAVRIKTQVWMENNFDYLAAQEHKRLKAENDKRHGIKTHTKKKRRMKPRDPNSADLPATPAESARQMLQERAMTRTKKLNYEISIDRLFDT